MARLKVKQIADFNTAVQTLIDNDADQNASIIAQISEDLSSEVSATNSDVASIDTVLGGLAGSGTVSSLETRISNDEVALSDAVGSLELLIDGNDTNIGLVSDALSAEISRTDVEVDSLEVLISDNLVAIGDNSSYIDDVSADLSAEISATNSDVASLEGYADANSTAISAILAGAAVNLDTFAEVISYVDSLDTADGGALTSQIASIDTRVSLNTSADAVLSAALSTEIAATNSDVTSIDAVLAGVGTSANITSLDTYIDGVSTALSTEISSTNSEVVSLDAYIDDVSADLSAEIAATGTEITDLQAADLRLHQFGTFLTPTSFTITQAVDVTATADTLVFINGHNIHVESEGIDGWSSLDGQTFNLANIGYDIDAEDHIYVVAPRA